MREPAHGEKMAKTKAWEVNNEFWSGIEPLISVRQRVADQFYARKSGGGRKPKDPRPVFEAIGGFKTEIDYADVAAP